LRTPDLRQQPVLGIKETPRTGSCESVESHHLLLTTQCIIHQCSHGQMVL